MHHRASLAIRLAAIVAGILAVCALHQITPHELVHWHHAIQSLYYLPIVFAGLAFGWRGGLTAAILAGMSNVPYNLLIWRLLPNSAIDQFWDLPLFCAAGILSGVMAERGRRQHADLQRTTERLSEVYRELQDNFEQMKRAERLSALGQLSAGLAHEVRNPLASIAGAAGILQRNAGLAPKEAECLTIIVRECQRLNELLTHFLAFARPRAPRFQTTDLAALFASVIELAGHAVGRKRIVMHSDISPAVGPVECDPEMLKQVLLNLVINAIEATPETGEVVLRARVRQGRVVAEVIDQGSGINAVNRDRIFDPFFTTKETGTGLGLSVAHQIIEQHGGILTAEPNPTRGMTFSVLFPARQEKSA